MVTKDTPQQPTPAANCGAKIDKIFQQTTLFVNFFLQKGVISYFDIGNYCGNAFFDVCKKPSCDQERSVIIF